MNNRALGFVFSCTLFFPTMEVALTGMAGGFGAMQVNITRFLVAGPALLPSALRGVRTSGVRMDAATLARLAPPGLAGIAVSVTLSQLAAERVPANVVASSSAPAPPLSWGSPLSSRARPSRARGWPP